MLHFRYSVLSLFVGIALCLSTNVYAQFESLKDNIGIPLKEKTYIDVEGSPFLYNDWSLGTVTLEDGRRVEPTRVKYNVYEDELDMIFNNSPIAVHKNEVKAFTLQQTTDAGKNKTYTFNKVELDGEKVYLEVLHKGNFVFYKHHKKTLDAPQNNTYGAGAYNTKRFISSEKYYLKTPEGIQEMKPKVNNLIKLMPDKKARIKELSRSGSGDYNSEMGIAMLLSMLEE